MPGLRELQHRFVEAVLSGCFAAVADKISVIDSTPERRLAIYRNNTLANLRSTLCQVYPIVEALVGPVFFRPAADAYIAAHPSTSGDLNDYGGSFADFLAVFPPAAELCYLADVARLEWAVEKARYAPDHSPMQLQRLAQIPPARYGELRFQLHPALALIRSDYPLYAIWQAHQADYHGEGRVDLDSGGAQLLVTRRGSQTVVEPVDRAEFMFLVLLNEGQRLSNAVDSALEHDPAFALQQRLTQRVSNGDIVDFSLDRI